MIFTRESIMEKTWGISPAVPPVVSPLVFVGEVPPAFTTAIEEHQNLKLANSSRTLGLSETFILDLHTFSNF